MTVVKVGGSLLGLHGLGPALRTWRISIPGPVLYVPGGGAVADVVRQWDAVHRPGGDWAHRQAIQAMEFSADLLRTLTDDPVVVPAPDDLPDTFPRGWAVTSDSMAAWVADVRNAERLILLKSIDVPPGTTWSDAARNGWVDEYFPTIASKLDGPIEVVNFRRWILNETGRGEIAPPG